MFSLVFPCHSSNLDTIIFVIECFLKQKEYINQIIVIFNSVKEDISDIINKIKLLCNNIIFEYKIFKSRINPGIARNKSYDLIKSDYVIFHDADDEPHPNKLEIIKYMFYKLNCDEIHHLLQPISLQFLNYDLNNIKYKEVDNKEILNFIKKGSVCLNNYVKMPVSHGLISIKKDKLLEIEWNCLRSGEDRDFITKSVNNNNKIVVVEAFLSKYDKLSKKSLFKYYPKYYTLFP